MAWLVVDNDDGGQPILTDWEWISSEARREVIEGRLDLAEILSRGFDAQFYEARQVLSDKIAACVVMAPELAPDRDALPRDLVTCSGLRCVLRESVLLWRKTDGARLAQAVARCVGMDYVLHLLGLLEVKQRGEFALVSQLCWYCAKLYELELADRRHQKLIQEIWAMRDRDWDHRGPIGQTA